ncbi:MAG: Modification methylase HindIII [Deltaproteobacteria bacterium ADurb.BinA179]|nr:MAG: Modification methylase HindIII [Deltaproteobacteria bacterium ADurb.BinA179]
MDRWVNKILLGVSEDVLKEMPDNSISSIVTDPPYGLKFMGKKWDYDVPSVALWEEAYRVLKPGAHVLSFGGTRTYHRMVVNIEDAGFEIRDQILWIYGSGFPKSLDVSKAIDKAAGEYVPGDVLPSSRATGKSVSGIATAFRLKTAANPQSDLSRQWQGWGTALKPACEPLILATKPLTVVPLDDMLQAETTLGGLICLSLSSVKYVESLLALSPKEYEGASVSAHLIAGALHGIRSGELSGRTDMFKSPEMVKIILSIVELWKTTLDVNYSRQNTFTIETALSLTTALRTFTLLISGIIQESITLEGAKELGRLLNVSIAAKNLKEQIATSKKETSVQELVSFLTMQNTANIAVKNFMPVVRIANSALLNATINLEEEFKPNLEPICLARKPLEGTVANNVLKWGTGGINIDDCRIEGIKGVPASLSNEGQHGWSTGGDMTRKSKQNGRWPANFIHDGSDEVLQHFPESNGQQGAVTGNEPSSSINNCYGQFNGRPATTPRNDTGSAARFFKQCNFTEDENEQRIKYCAKASTSERGDGNNHPTVKPLDLIKYLVKLITPPDGIVLDMFGGSGTTALACLDLGFPYIVIEKEPDYVFIANERIKQATRQERLFL